MKVGIEALIGRLRLRFTRLLLNGNQKYLSFNLADTAENRVVVEIKAQSNNLKCQKYFKNKPNKESLWK